MTTNQTTKLLHIKLDKFLYGNNQHIFKTEMNLSSINNISGTNYNIILNQSNIDKTNTVLYSNYVNGSNTQTYQLYDYDEINFIYTTSDNTEINRIKPYINNISDFYKSLFYKNLTLESDKQNIYYFNNISKPIDIINIDNTGYFLSPLQTIKNIEITEQKSLLQYKNYDINATNKQYYNQMWKYNTNRTMNFSENNNIPIYDIAFNFIDTVNLSTYNNLTNFITKYNFQEISSNIIYINDNENYYSINIHFLLQQLNGTLYNYKYNNEAITRLLEDLLSYIPIHESINKYIDKYAVISKLNKDYVNKIINSPILSSLFDDTIQNIKYIFNKRYVDNFLVNEIPQNTLYLANLNKSVSLPDIFYNKISASLNFVNLKNQENPEYQYDIQYPDELYDIINYYPQTKYITLTNDNNISYNGTPIYINLQPDEYIIKYVSGVFYKKQLIYTQYENNFIYIFYPSGITEASGNLTSATIKDENGKIKEEYKNDINNTISSHILEAAFNKEKQVIQPEKTLSTIFPNKFAKARGIDWTVPPTYYFNISKFENNKNQKWYKGINQRFDTSDYTAICFLSGSVFVCDTNDKNKNLLINDFIQIEKKDISLLTAEQKNQQKIVSGNIIYTDDTKTNQLKFYFNNNKKIEGSCTFAIIKKSSEDTTINIKNNIDNISRMILFEADKNKSYKFNTNTSYDYSQLNNKNYMNPTKTNVSTLLLSASILDNEIAKLNENYKNNYQVRMSDKIDNYYKGQFNEFHIENNRCAQLGNLNGLRIYEKIGKTNNNILWTSYKYITTKNNNIINTLSINNTLPFKAYNINRIPNNMQTNELGNINYKGINNIKAMVITSGKTQYGFYDYNHNCYLCSATFHCKIPCSIMCSAGYCTFPYNNSDKDYSNYSITPNNVYYNKLNINETNNISSNIYLITVNKNKKYKLIAKTDINVSDDIEIYFISNDINNADIINLFNNPKFKYYSYKSIFQGFGGLNNKNANDILYKDYLMINNKNNTHENKYITTNISMYFNKLHEYINQYNKNSSNLISTLFINKTINTQLYNLINLNNNQYFIDNYNVSSLTLTSAEISILSAKINDILFDSKYSFILSSKISLYNKYASNTIIPNHIQLSYKDVAYTNLYNMLITNNKYKNILENFKQKVSISETYTLSNGYVITKYSPFNGPHTINMNTELYGMLLSGSSTSEIFQNLNKSNISDLTNIYEIPKHYNVIIRIVNWWDNLPKCTGSLKLQPIKSDIENDTVIQQINDITNKYDFIECLNENSIIRTNQGNYKKSNIYSVKVKNSGLNPNNEILNDLKLYIPLKDYIDLNQNYKKLYEHISMNQINNDIIYAKTQSNDQSILNTYYYQLNYISENTSISFLQIQKPVIPTLSGTYDPFTEKLYNFYTDNDGYYILNQEQVELIKQIKIDLRNNFENAIKNSVSRYMPVETKLWKIIYEGK